MPKPQDVEESESATLVADFAVEMISLPLPSESKLYRRRFVGLAQIVLLNVVVSWNWICFAPVSNYAAEFLGTSESDINWFSIAVLFAFVPTSILATIALARLGSKGSILVCCGLLLIGSWVKYAGMTTRSFTVVLIGQIFIGFSQPFILNAPTSFSALWFDSKSRTTATAIGTLANPLGAALGQVITPLWATGPDQLSDTVLYINIVATASCLPALFIPSRPVLPPELQTFDNQPTQSLWDDFVVLVTTLEFYLILVPFSCFVGFFNSFSTLLNQILSPYGFTELQSGIAGALLIGVGLITAAISTPLVDRYRFHLGCIRICIPILAAAYLSFYWAPPSESIELIYIICGIVGGASFALVPLILEFIVEIFHPVHPSLAPSICWSGGQLMGGTLTIVMNVLKEDRDANPPNRMQNSLLLLGILGFTVAPLPLSLGLFGRNHKVKMRRTEQHHEHNSIDMG
ncbi:unnamed protein product [Clonostachys rosea]|uniref:Major facilitator superfamily (MFS) profile domain-containing protein n=1 Tax=Bionectria ochroleuca TaxID=29856 RepID=A0ABY6TMS4_BIOOC|nr:unnamed protein product [Clonostachys rosea]